MEREGRAGLKGPLLEKRSSKGIITHVFPMNLFLQPWQLGQRVYQIMKAGIVQYVSFIITKLFFSTPILDVEHESLCGNINTFIKTI